MRARFSRSDSTITVEDGVAVVLGDGRAITLGDSGAIALGDGGSITLGDGAFSVRLGDACMMGDESAVL